MKRYKQIDTWLQLPVIISLFIWCLVKPVVETVATACFIAACWQLSSMTIHEWNGWFTGPHSIRRMYHRVVLLCIISIPLGSFTILIIIAPFMFTFYTYLCYRELYVKMRRPLALLK